MPKDYFAQYESPNIVIVPTVRQEKKTLDATAGAVAANTGPSTIQQIDTGSLNVLSKAVNNTFVNNDRNMSRNIQDLDSVEEALRQLHNVQTAPAEISSQHEATFISNSNLYDLTNNIKNNIRTGRVTSKSLESLYKQEIQSKGAQRINIEANREHVPHFVNCELTEQSTSRYRSQNNSNADTYSSTVTINNTSSTTTSYKTENKIKHINSQDQKKDSRRVINQAKKKDTSCKSNSKSKKIEKEKQIHYNDKNEHKTCLERHKVLNVKASSSDKKHDNTHFESRSKRKLSLPSTEQKTEHENIEANNDVLKYAILSHEQKDDISTGALKRYLDYQRFLGKCYEKNGEKSCLVDPYVSEERTRNFLKRTKDKETVKIKTIIEQKEEEDKLKLKSITERAKKKQESKKKIKSYKDKNISNKDYINIEHKKNMKDRKEKASTERIKKKEEIKIKLTSYMASKKKDKSIERHAQHAKKIDSFKKHTNLSDKMEQSKDRKNENSKHILQKKSSNNSEERQMKKEILEKANKIKEVGLKRKNTDCEQERTTKLRKTELSTLANNSSSKKRRDKTPTPIRTVDVIKETSCHNLPSSCASNIDLRSKLSRKRTINKCNKGIAHVKPPAKPENLLVTLKQKVQAKPAVRSQAASKPKIKTSKKIKLVINIKCPNSNDDSDDVANESEQENTSPHQDLSFLDDIDIDGIVDSLNGYQRIKTPNRESSIRTEENFIEANINKSSTNVEDLKKDCTLETTRHPHLLPKNEDSNIGSIARVINAQVNTTQTNVNLVKEYNDDVYEVIDITGEVENNIILVDDTTCVSTDQKGAAKKLMKSYSQSGNKSDSFQNIPIIHINDDSRDGIDMINFADAEVNERQLPDAKYLLAKAAILDVTSTIEAKGEPGYTILESPNKDLTINPKTENDNINIKSEYIGESEIVLRSDSIPNDADNAHIKIELFDGSIYLSRTIKKEVYNASIHPFLNIENEDNEGSIVHLPNVKKEVSNGVIPLSTSVKKESHDETIHIAKIIKSENVSVSLPVQLNIESKEFDISPVNEFIVQNATIIKSENTNCALSEYGSNSKKESKNATAAEVHECKSNQNEKTETKIQSIPRFGKLKIHNNVKKPYAAPMSKNVIKSEIKTCGNLSKGYINAMEKKMFDYLHKKYTVLDFIHCGYFSNIYKCKDPNGGLYAVKVLKSSFLSTGIYKLKIFKGLEKITCKGGYFNLEIISTFNIGAELCLLTEFYPKTLAQVLANQQFLHIDVVQSLSCQLVSAVSMLTCNYIVHSDIKPEHILLNSTDDKLKLCGFDRADYNYNIKIIPSSGTVNYRAPEIILGFEAGFKIDVWATALIMYEMASGNKLFPGCYNNQVLYHQICTLGPIHVDMLKKGTHVHRHFTETKFMKQIGPRVRTSLEWVCLTEFPVESHKLRNFTRTVNNDRALIRTLQHITEGPDKIEMLQNLLKRMLVIHPRYRMSITGVASNEFLCKRDTPKSV